jgi:hypothetical protein
VIVQLPNDWLFREIIVDEQAAALRAWEQCRKEEEALIDYLFAEKPLDSA